MKVTKDNRHKVVEYLQDLKKQITDNDIEEFYYNVDQNKGNNIVSVKLIIKQK